MNNIDLIPISTNTEIDKYISDIVLKNDFVLLLKNKRKTKLGDFRPFSKRFNSSLITINRDLNQYHVLFTFLHEYAHYLVFKKYKTKLKPHGKEWKQIFSNLLIEVVSNVSLPLEIKEAFVKHSYNPKYSSFSDNNLIGAFKLYDENNQEVTYLNDLNKGDVFRLQNGRVFEKLDKKRSRIWCREINTNSIFAINQNAVVEIHN